MAGYAGSGQWSIWYGPTKPDLLKTVHSAIGLNMTPTYSPMTVTSNYTQNASTANPPQYPAITVKVPVNLVTQLTADTGATDSSGTTSVTTNYGYDSAIARLDGRGYLGFSSFSYQDNLSQILHTTYYSMQWPTYGMTLSSTQTMPNGTSLLSQGTTQFASQQPNAASPQATPVACVQGASCIVYAQVVKANTWDLATGTALPWSMTTATTDNLGNPTDILVQTFDGNATTPTGFQKESKNAYWIATSGGKWFPGRVVQSTVSSTTP
jgi:hypothetical protein